MTLVEVKKTTVTEKPKGSQLRLYTMSHEWPWKAAQDSSFPFRRFLAYLSYDNTSGPKPA